MNEIKSSQALSRLLVLDPVCGMNVIPPGKGHSHFHDENYYFCNTKCKIKFDAEPEKYLKKENKKMLTDVQENESVFGTYKPLIIIFSYILLIGLAAQVKLGDFMPKIFMNHIMAGFFIGLSFFKFLDLKSFAESFSNYDPLAKKISAYGFIYPFVEISIGFLFAAGVFLNFANLATALILSVTTVGVVRQLNSKSKFQCACLGSGFNLPLSRVTVLENVLMIAMAIFNLTDRI